MFRKGPLALIPRAAVLSSHFASELFVKDRRCGSPFWNMLLLNHYLSYMKNRLKTEKSDA